ncbi:MAG: AAA family ATPase [Blastocatellia bacterium]
MEFPIDAANKEFLERYYRPDNRSNYFYRVFRPSDKNKHWNRPDYAAKGLQSINTRTFGDAFIHEKNTNFWGWKPGYVEILAKELRSKIPILDLAVWLYRDRDWREGTTAQDIIATFKQEFRISEEEERRLFDLSRPYPSLIEEEKLDFQPEQVTWQELREKLDPNPPPDFKPEEGGILRLLTIQGVGPARTIVFEPAERLSLITGDNGLGKTFLIECAWWALTGNWAGLAAYPRSDSKIDEPKISFLIAGEESSKPIPIAFHRETNSWPPPKKRPTIPGLTVYARVDGSFAVWDPMMNHHLLDSLSQKAKEPLYFVFTREEVWKGLDDKINGLLWDWVSWQVQPEKHPFRIFQKVLHRLSPPDFRLEPGEPVRLPGTTAEIPTLKHPYGEVPIVFESAGVRRIITLAYLIVWAWNEHKVYSGLARKEPQSNLVILVDEMEAHLHPQWQRVVLPALLDVGAELSEDLENELQVQLIVATHSPLVTASVEPLFDSEKDKLFHLEMESSGNVKLEELRFLVYGSFDSWLTSKVFGLPQAKNPLAEDAIQRAIALQQEEKPDPEEVRKVSDDLQKYLSAEDTFWPRWLYFAEQHGVKL